MKFINKLLRDEAGATAIEYGLTRRSHRRRFDRRDRRTSVASCSRPSRRPRRRWLKPTRPPKRDEVPQGTREGGGETRRPFRMSAQ